MATLKEQVIKHSHVAGECRLWTGAMSRTKRPITNVEKDGKTKLVDIQLFLARKKFSLANNIRVGIKTTCGNPNCINVNHVELVPITRASTPRNRTDSVVSVAENNINVFKLAVTNPVEVIARDTNISKGSVLRILKNEAMLPYFQMRIEHFCGEPLEKLRTLSVEALREKGLAQKAIAYIQSEHNFRIVDEDLYLKVLSHCKVLGEHLVWNGEFINDIPVIRELSGRRRSAVKLFLSSVTGKQQDNIICACGYDGCINPYHLE